MHDGRLNAGHGGVDHVGNVWDDDNASDADGCSRRLLRGSRAVLGRGRAAQGAQLQKKKALTSAKVISATKETLRLNCKAERRKCKWLR